MLNKRTSFILQYTGGGNKKGKEENTHDIASSLHADGIPSVI
jgi:hypothetical protein